MSTSPADPSASDPSLGDPSLGDPSLGARRSDLAAEPARRAGALLGARSVAVVGASDRPGSFGGQVLRNLVDFGFPGEVYGVHPRLTGILGRPCAPRLRELPERPDCVALAVGNRGLLGAFEEVAAAGVPSAVVFGDPTVGDARDPTLQGRLAALARGAGIALCGPNAMGVYALHRGLVISGYPVRPGKVPGHVALITASGTVFDALSQNDRDIRFNYVISGGNEAGLSAADYLRYVVEDESTRVVGLYLETVRDPAGFTAGLRRAAERGLPVVALKVGLSERGRAMAQAHTGALAGSARTYGAVFRKYGVCQVRSLDEMVDALELLSRVPEVRRPGVGVLMESGGERSLVADLAADCAVPLSVFGERTTAALAAVVEPGVGVDNPLDAFGTGREVAETYRRCLLAMDADPDTGLVLLAVDLARDSYLSPRYVEAALAARGDMGGPLAGLVNATTGAGEPLTAALRAAGIPVLMGTETGMRAISHLIARSSGPAPVLWPAQHLGRPAPQVVESLRDTLARAAGPLSEQQSRTLLAAYGFRAPRERIVATLADAVQAAEWIAAPVVLKTAAAGVVHKTDVGGVALDLRTPVEVERAYRSLSQALGPPVLVQEMAPPGLDLILGMYADPQFGPVLLLGLGGVLVEIYRDVAAVLPPLSTVEAAALPGRLRGAALLDGPRGAPAVDRALLTDALLRFATLAHDLGDLIREMDVNPLRIGASEASVLDALVIPAGVAAQD